MHTNTRSSRTIIGKAGAASTTTGALHGLLDVLEDPGVLDRGFAQHLIDHIDAILHAAGAPRRAGSAQPMRAAVETDETAALPPGTL